MMKVWSNWALDTAISVSVLIALILLSRRAVIRYAGIEAAYALWSLPLIRLFLPNIPVLSSPKPKALSGDILQNADIGSVMAVTPSINWLYVTLTIWGAGIIFALIRFSFAQLKSMQDINMHGQNPDPSIIEVSLQCARALGLKSAPKIRLIKNASPMVTGFIRPVIVLPHDFSGLFSARQQRLILMHELAHIARRDLWAQFAAQLFVTVNWPNPLAHIAKRYFRLDQEAACDKHVLNLIDNERGARAAYAGSLLCAVQIFAPKPATSLSRLKTSVGAAPLSLNIHHPFKERLMMIKTHRQTPRGRRAVIALLMSTAILASAPLTPAQTSDTLTETSTSSQRKQVMRSVTIDDNGNKTQHHYEVTTDNGVTQAWKIDELGNRIQISLSEVEAFEASLPTPPDAPNLVEGIEITDGVEFSDQDGLPGQHVVIRRVSNSSSPDITEVEMAKIDAEVARVMAANNGGNLDIQIDIDENSRYSSSMKLGVANDMLQDIDENELTPNARRKLDKARRALIEAQNAVVDESK